MTWSNWRTLVEFSLKSHGADWNIQLTYIYVIMSPLSIRGRHYEGSTRAIFQEPPRAGMQPNDITTESYRLPNFFMKFSMTEEYRLSSDAQDYFINPLTVTFVP